MHRFGGGGDGTPSCDKLLLTTKSANAIFKQRVCSSERSARGADLRQGRQGRERASRTDAPLMTRVTAFREGLEERRHMAAIVPMELERACDKSETDDY